MALKLIDLSIELYQGMTTFPMHQPVFIMRNMTYEENMKATGSKTLGFSARNILMSEHSGTHTDAINEYKPGAPTLSEMSLDYFWGSAICVDLSHIRFPAFIRPDDLKRAVAKSGQEIRKGDKFLMYTGHYDREFGTDRWQTEYTGLSYEAGRWLAEQGVVNVGVDAPAIDQSVDIDFSGHRSLGEYNVTNTENLCNLDKLVGKRFLYFGLPLPIRDGSGSPIRAIALVDE